MELPANDTTPELSESLRRLAESDVLWARLIGKFLKPLRIPTQNDRPNELRQV
jgi:hypothetical protein